MRLFILRGHATTLDPWETFARQCVSLVDAHMDAMVSVDFSSLGADAATRFLELMGAGPEGVFLALCHGSADGLWMPKTTQYIGIQEAALFRGKFCYLVACSAAKGLGPLAVKNGAKGYIGFSDTIYGVPQHLEDEQRRALMSGLIAYLQGEAVPVAAQILKKTFRDIAHGIAKQRKDPIRDAPVIGHMMMCEKLVRHGI